MSELKLNELTTEDLLKDERVKRLVEALEMVAFKSEFVACYQDELHLTRKQAREALAEWTPL